MICGGIEYNQQMMKNFHESWICKKGLAKFCTVGKRLKRILKGFNKVLLFVIKISMQVKFHNRSSNVKRIFLGRNMDG